MRSGHRRGKVEADLLRSLLSADSLTIVEEANGVRVDSLSVDVLERRSERGPDESTGNGEKSVRKRSASKEKGGEEKADCVHQLLQGRGLLDLEVYLSTIL